LHLVADETHGRSAVNGLVFDTKRFECNYFIIQVVHEVMTKHNEGKIQNITISIKR